MSDTGKQSPLGVNSLCSLLANTGLTINTSTAALTGVSQSESTYTPGSVVNDSGLYWLTHAMHAAYVGGVVDSSTYFNLYNIGSTTIPALGNAKPGTYTRTGWPKWNPYTIANTYADELTSWGYVRLFALQAWNEFNYNSALPYYGEFIQSFSTASGFIGYTNQVIMTMHNSKSFLEGTHSNMDDLITADITNQSLATPAFGQDLITSGKAIDLSTISTFGLPSNLLTTLRRYNALTAPVSLALLNSGIPEDELRAVLNDKDSITNIHQKLMYQAFLSVTGTDLADVLIILNCKTPEMTSLADLLNPKKLFPNSYSTLTVPLYNNKLSPANSKTYYPIYEGGEVSSRLNSPEVNEQAGTQYSTHSSTPDANSSRVYVAQSLTKSSVKTEQLEKAKNATLAINKIAGVLNNDT